MDLIESVQEFVVSPTSAMVQLAQPTSSDGSPVIQPHIKKFIISDQQTGSEILYGMEIKGAGNDPDLRGFHITTKAGETLIKLGYVYQRQLGVLEFSTPTDSHICKAYPTMNPSFFCRFLCIPCCPCLICYLWKCVPAAYIKFQDSTQKNLMEVDGYISKKYVARNSSGNKSELATFQMGTVSRSDLNCRVTFKPDANRDDKLLLLAFAVGSMDYDRIQQSRTRYVRS